MRNQQKEKLKDEYEQYVAMGLRLDMSRGKPCAQQLELSMPMLTQMNFTAEDGTDARNYGCFEGVPEARRFFAQLLSVAPEETLVGGNSSLHLMFQTLEYGMRRGFDGQPGWMGQHGLKWICPVPGYDRHFQMAQQMGFELLPVPMTEQGPQMEQVMQLAADPLVKGIWCVPKYANPDGCCYTAQTVQQLAQMKTAAPDFKIFWDNAYAVHDFETIIAVPSILDACRAAGHESRAVLFTSLSKVTFPGAAVAAMAACSALLHELCADWSSGIISFDKMNQLRHVRFLKNMDGLRAHMRRHREILAPKFRQVLAIFEKELADCADTVWTTPQGGYFISLFTPSGCAARTIDLCAKAGLKLTPAGSAYPYGHDDSDRHLRIAPSYLTAEQLDTAAKLVCVALKLAAAEKNACALADEK